MKLLFLMLLFCPLITLGHEAPNEKTLARLQKLCREDTTPELRQLYCQLAKDYRKEKKRIDAAAAKKKKPKS